MAYPPQPIRDASLVSFWGAKDHLFQFVWLVDLPCDGFSLYGGGWWLTTGPENYDKRIQTTNVWVLSRHHSTWM